MNKITQSIVTAISMIGIASADTVSSHHSLLNDWTGIYVGANAGVAFNNAQLRSQQLGFTDPSETCNASSNSSTFFPGVQLGYLHQFPNNVVSGIEANVTINTNQTITSNCVSAYNSEVSDQFSFNNQLQSSIKGRVGRTFNWHNNILLPYLTAGVSFANVDLTYQNEGGDYYYKSTTAPGWLVGTGIEWALSQNLSFRAEYFYVNYGNAINMNIPSVYGLIDPNGGARVNLSSNNVMLSINYWI